MSCSFQGGANYMGRSIEWRSPREGEGRTFRKTIQFGRRSDAGTGYMSHSDRVGPSIMLLHEFFGLQDSFKAYADELNAEGFTVLVPDLYDGEIVETVEEAERMAQAALEDERTLRRLVAAAEHMTANWHPRLGVIGFSLGAAFAVALAHERPVDAVVVYYGLGEFKLDRWSAPVLGHFAEVDEWEPVEGARTAFAGLADAGIEAELHIYPETTHWFANRAVGDAYNPDAARVAMDRTLAFLRWELA